MKKLVISFLLVVACLSVWIFTHKHVEVKRTPTTHRTTTSSEEAMIK